MDLKFLALLVQGTFLEPVGAALVKSLADGKITVEEGANMADAVTTAAETLLPNQAIELELVSDLAKAVEKFSKARDEREAAKVTAPTPKLAITGDMVVEGPDGTHVVVEKAADRKARLAAEAAGPAPEQPATNSSGNEPVQ